MTRTSKTYLVDLGLISYAEAFDLQCRLVEARKNQAASDFLLFCQHRHVITLGRNGKQGNLRAGMHVLKQMNVEFHHTDRGGDITYHGPGQIVGYPILDLTQHRRDIHWYVTALEEFMIRTTADFGIVAKRCGGCRGVWVDTPRGEEKLAALGVHLSRWITSHGVAYNVSPDLRLYDLIVPCGIVDKGVTSLERLLDRRVPLADVQARLAAHFADVFETILEPISAEELKSKLPLKCPAFHPATMAE